MKEDWPELLSSAQAEVQGILDALPPALRATAQALTVVYERRPARALQEEGLDPDLLGLFVGDPVAEEGVGSVLPARMLLFLQNLWEFAEGDAEIFREEVRTTYLHELGHYLGLDEDDLGERGLE